MPVIYIDMLVFTNMTVDGVLLSLTALFRNRVCRKYRLLLAAVFGGVFSLTVLIPSSNLLFRLMLNLIGALVMILICFGFHNRYEYIKTVATLYVVMLLLSAITYAIWLFLSPQGIIKINGTYVYMLSPLELTLFIAIAYCVIRIGRHFFADSESRQMMTDITIENAGKTVSVRAFSDSGNMLSEPLSGLPVIVADAEAVRPLFSVEEWNLFLSASYGNADMNSEYLKNINFRIVPYSVIGHSSILPSFCPDHIFISDGKRKIEKRAYIAICGDHFSNGTYKALIPISLTGFEYKLKKGRVK